MADKLYVNEDGSLRELGLQPAPEFAQRIEALEQQNAAQNEAISAAQSSANAVASETNLGRVKLSDSTSSTSAASEGIAASPKAVKDAYDKAVEAVPAGSVVAFAGNLSSAPSGYLLCNGAAVSRTTYAALFAAIGTTYGAGNGSSTFNLPNLTDRFIQGSGTAGATKAAGLPGISGSFGRVPFVNSIEASGAFILDGQAGAVSTGYNTTQTAYVGLNASRSSEIYGSSTTVQPPAVTMRYYIKY